MNASDRSKLASWLVDTGFILPRIRNLKERGIEGLCAGMQAGDLMVVSELSRLGRSVGQIIQIIDDLVKNQIRFVAIKENIQLR